MIIKQSPTQPRRPSAVVDSETEVLLSEDDVDSQNKDPIFISVLDEKAIAAYAQRLRQFVKSRLSTQDNLEIEDLAFNINRQSNWSLGRKFVFSVKSISGLDKKLVSINIFLVNCS